MLIVFLVVFAGRRVTLWILFMRAWSGVRELRCVISFNTAGYLHNCNGITTLKNTHTHAHTRAHTHTQLRQQRGAYSVYTLYTLYLQWRPVWSEACCSGEWRTQSLTHRASKGLDVSASPFRPYSAPKQEWQWHTSEGLRTPLSGWSTQNYQGLQKALQALYCLTARHWKPLYSRDLGARSFHSNELGISLLYRRMGEWSKAMQSWMPFYWGL